MSVPQKLLTQSQSRFALFIYRPIAVYTCAYICLIEVNICLLMFSELSCAHGPNNNTNKSTNCGANSNTNSRYDHVKVWGFAGGRDVIYGLTY